MFRIALFSAAAVLLVASASRAEMPSFAGDQTQAMTIMQRTRQFAGANWWSRYGEPVNAVAMEAAEKSPSDFGGTVPMHGYGYVFGPGSCDCSPPCIWGLWTGYYQNPKRCHPGHHGGRHCGGCGQCGDCCGLFGRGRCGDCGVSCGASACGAPACGAPVSCNAPVSCGATVSDCGCKPVCGKCRHFHRHAFRGFMAHWNSGCDSCSAPLGCGCATPVVPFMSEKQAFNSPPRPMPEEAALLPLPRLN